MREWMTGVHGKRGQHWENFLLKVTICPGSAFRRQLRDFAHVNPVLCQLGQQLVFPKRILRSHQLAHRLLNAVEQLCGAQTVRTTSLVSLSICCLIPATRISKNSSRFELKIVRNLTRSMSGCVGSCASSRTRRLNASQLSSRLMKFFGSPKRSWTVWTTCGTAVASLFSSVRGVAWTCGIF